MIKVGFCAFALVALLASAGGFDTPAAAEERMHCLNRNEQRAAIAEGKAVPLAKAIRAAGRSPREIIRARLCQEPERLIYLLTVLERGGKVRRQLVDAANGNVVGASAD